MEGAEVSGFVPLARSAVIGW